MKENHQRHNEMLCKKTATYTTIERIVNNKNPANKTYVQEHHASLFCTMCILTRYRGKLSSNLYLEHDLQL